MRSASMNVEASQPASVTTSHLFDDWFDPIEAGIRDRVRMFIEEMIRGELDAVAGRLRIAVEWDLSWMAREGSRSWRRVSMPRRSMSITAGRLPSTVLSAVNGAPSGIEPVFPP
jgi:hypothetical protein